MTRQEKQLKEELIDFGTALEMAARRGMLGELLNDAVPENGKLVIPVDTMIDSYYTIDLAAALLTVSAEGVSVSAVIPAWIVDTIRV